MKVAVDPSLVDTTGAHPVTVNVTQGNMTVTITSEGIILDFWDDDSDGDPHHTIGMTFDEWRDHARRIAVPHMIVDPVVEKYYGGENPF